jgi:hypothetical protein
LKANFEHSNKIFSQKCSCLMCDLVIFNILTLKVYIYKSFVSTNYLFSGDVAKSNEN